MTHSPPLAPKGDGEVLLAPPEGRLVEFFAEAQRWLADMNFSIGGMPAGELRAQAHREICQLAGSELPRPWILTGHQPGMIHAGVWFKDAVLSALAAVTGGSALHLVADLDTIKHTDLKIPVLGKDNSIEMESVEFAFPHGAQSFAQLRPPERPVLDALIARANQALVWPSVFPHWAALATGHRATSTTLARWLTEGRSGINGMLGLRVRNVFLSDVVGQGAFMQFACEILLRHRDVHRLHEEVLREYRARHGITDKTQPVPDLGRHEEAYEVPLWVYRQGRPRQGLFVRQSHDGQSLELSDPTGLVGVLPVGHEQLPRALAELMQRCVYLAPRAITLTMFMRLFLADVFVHGIGGAVYDEVTDALAERWLGAAPPPFVTATATVHLPLPHNHVGEKELAAARWQVHHAYHNPELVSAGAHDSPDHDWQGRKRELLARMENSPRFSEERAVIFAELQQLNAEMRRRLPQSQQLPQQHLEQVQRQRTRDELAESREYFFAFMPREKLVNLIEQAEAWASAAFGTPPTASTWGAEKGNL